MIRLRHMVLQKCDWLIDYVVDKIANLFITTFLPARRYASAGYRDRNVSVRPSVRPSRAGIVAKRKMLAA